MPRAAWPQRWKSRSHSGLAPCWGARKPTQGPQGAPRSCKSVFLKTLAPQPTSTCPPQAPGPGFECLLSPDLLCSVRSRAPCPSEACHLNPRFLGLPAPQALGTWPLPGVGPAPCPPGRPLHHQPRWLFSSDFRLLADLTLCTLTGNPQSETLGFPGAALLRGVCKVVNLCGPTEFHCGSWLGRNPEGWPRASWGCGGQPRSPLESPAHRSPWSFLGWTHRVCHC